MTVDTVRISVCFVLFCWFSAGISLDKLGFTDLAISDFTMVLELDSATDANPNSNPGDALSQAGAPPQQPPQSHSQSQSKRPPAALGTRTQASYALASPQPTPQATRQQPNPAAAPYPSLGAGYATNPDIQRFTQHLQMLPAVGTPAAVSIPIHSASSSVVAPSSGRRRAPPRPPC